MLPAGYAHGEKGHVYEHLPQHGRRADFQLAFRQSLSYQLPPIDPLGGSYARGPRRPGDRLSRPGCTVGIWESAAPAPVQKWTTVGHNGQRRTGRWFKEHV